MKKVKGLFTIKHLRILTLLIILDLIATAIWFSFYGIEEANPILAGPIETSIFYFGLIKLGLSAPGILLLRKYIAKKISQAGIGLLLFCYYTIAVIHCVILLEVL